MLCAVQSQQSFLYLLVTLATVPQPFLAVIRRVVSHQHETALAA